MTATTTAGITGPSLNRRFAVTFPAMVLPLIASFFYFVIFPGTAFGNSFYSAIKIFLLTWPFIAVAWILREPIRNRALVKRHKASVLPGTIFGLIIVGLLFLLIKATPLSGVVAANQANIAGRITDLGVAEHFLAFALFISFAHAALEEFFWRWFVYGQLREMVSIPLAHLLAGVGFAAHHVVILSQFFPIGWAFALGVCVGIGGAVWSILYQRYGSLFGAWVSHMIIDLGLMWVGWEALKAA